MPELPELPRALTERVGFLLQAAVARAQQMGEQALAELGISGREYGALAVLAGGSPSAQHQIGAALGLDRTTTMTLLSGLQARGLVDRSRDSANRRAYLVTLTDAGQQLRTRAETALAQCDDRFLAPLPAGEQARLRTSLRRLLSGSPDETDDRGPASRS